MRVSLQLLPSHSTTRMAGAPRAARHTPAGQPAHTPAAPPPPPRAGALELKGRRDALRREAAAAAAAAAVGGGAGGIPAVRSMP